MKRTPETPNMNFRFLSAAAYPKRSTKIRTAFRAPKAEAEYTCPIPGMPEWFQCLCTMGIGKCDSHYRETVRIRGDTPRRLHTRRGQLPAFHSAYILHPFQS